MRIIATSDTHFVFPLPRDGKYPGVPEGDVLLHCGDLMYTGHPDEWYLRLGNLAAMPHAHKLIVPGNHDFHIQNYNGIARAELKNNAKFKLLDDHKPYTEIDGVQFFAIPGVTGLPGWAYNTTDQELERWLGTAYDVGRPADIVMSHAPPYLILDAINPEGRRVRDRKHVGSRALRRWFNELQVKPKYWFFGHIHESYGSMTVDGCEFHNVAMCDRDYKQVNRPHIIEIET